MPENEEAKTVGPISKVVIIVAAAGIVGLAGFAFLQVEQSGLIRQMRADLDRIDRTLTNFMRPGVRYTQGNADLAAAEMRNWVSARKIPPQEVVDKLADLDKRGSDLDKRVTVLELKMPDGGLRWFVRPDSVSP